MVLGFFWGGGRGRVIKGFFLMSRGFLSFNSGGGSYYVFVRFYILFGSRLGDS